MNEQTYNAIQASLKRAIEAVQADIDFLESVRADDNVIEPIRQEVININSAAEIVWQYHDLDS